MRLTGTVRVLGNKNFLVLYHCTHEEQSSFGNALK